MSHVSELLARFSEAHGTSGFEGDVRAAFIRECKKLVDDIQLTPLGSVIATKRAPRRRGATRDDHAPRVLIEAHMDEVGFVVTEIDQGFLRVDQIGSLDPRILPSQNVMVHGKRDLPGVIGSRPPHVLTAQERKESLPLSRLFVDVGMSDAQVRELVSIGDSITMDRQVLPLLNDAFAGKAFDDRSSMVVMLEMLRQLQGRELAWDVVVVANVNEEDSPVYVGAQTAAFRVRPQLAICLDVTHGQQHGNNREDMPRLGAGPGIARGANVHPFVFDRLLKAAQQESIPHQITVYGDDTQTNGWMMQVVGEGIPTGLVELPLRYMHTPVETIRLADIENAANLLVVFVSELERADADALQGEFWARETGARHNGNGRRANGRTKPELGRTRAMARASRTRSTTRRNK